MVFVYMDAVHNATDQHRVQVRPMEFPRPAWSLVAARLYLCSWTACTYPIAEFSRCPCGRTKSPATGCRQHCNRRTHHCASDAADIVDVLPGTSTKIRVRIQPAEAVEGLPGQLIVKGGFEDHSATMGPMYFNEMRFYRDVQPHVEIPSPRCFFACQDPGSHQSIVIMEDLTTRGVRFCDPLQPANRGPSGTSAVGHGSLPRRDLEQPRV